MPRLIVIMKASTPKQITLQAGQTAIGRAEQNQLTLDSPMVSRSHAVIETTGSTASTEPPSATVPSGPGSVTWLNRS